MYDYIKYVMYGLLFGTRSLCTSIRIFIDEDDNYSIKIEKNKDKIYFVYIVWIKYIY